MRQKLQEGGVEQAHRWGEAAGGLEGAGLRAAWCGCGGFRGLGIPRWTWSGQVLPSEAKQGSLGIEGQGWELLGDRRKRRRKQTAGALRRPPGPREIL